MVSRASRPPVRGATATQLTTWFSDLVIQGGRLLLESDTDDRQGCLDRASAAEFLRLHAAELVEHHIRQAQELGASNEAVAHALGVRPSTAMTRYPDPRRAARVARRKRWQDRDQTPGEQP